MDMRTRTFLILLSVTLLVWGCQTVYYDTMERMGIHKREILVDRVEAAQKSQEEAKEQFADVLEAFRATVKVDGGKLQETYDRLKAEFDESVSRADVVRTRIKDVKNVADALFDEWESELGQYTSESLRNSSKEQLEITRGEYGKLLTAMQTAESKMNPVLTVFNDQVLFLKHNLNARAIASIQQEVTNMEREVGNLIEDMNLAIAEAEAFVKQLKE
ncbi:MAG: DUF2959 domain-containing protein [Verrucomicrobia bacterium]|nr:DUF2959 domain-containing protein [Verrucomicrobiota bacterium]